MNVPTIVKVNFRRSREGENFIAFWGVYHGKVQIYSLDEQTHCYADVNWVRFHSKPLNTQPDTIKDYMEERLGYENVQVMKRMDYTNIE